MWSQIKHSYRLHSKFSNPQWQHIQSKYGSESQEVYLLLLRNFLTPRLVDSTAGWGPDWATTTGSGKTSVILCWAWGWLLMQEIIFSISSWIQVFQINAGEFRGHYKKRGFNKAGKNLPGGCNADVGWVLTCNKWTETIIFGIIWGRRSKMKMNSVIAAASLPMMMMRGIGWAFVRHGARRLSSVWPPSSKSTSIEKEETYYFPWRFHGIMMAHASGWAGDVLDFWSSGSEGMVFSWLVLSWWYVYLSKAWGEYSISKVLEGIKVAGFCSLRCGLLVKDILDSSEPEGDFLTVDASCYLPPNDAHF